MELSELALTRLVIVSVVLAVIACFALAAASTRRRVRRFEALARSLGAAMVKENKFHYRFALELEGRSFDIRYQHIGGSSSSGGWTPDWYVVTSTPLRSVSELHSAELRFRSRRAALTAAPEDFEQHFSMHDSGYPLPKGWLTGRLKRSVTEFFGLDLHLERLVIEEATLLHRSRHLLRRLEGGTLRELLMRHGAVASALESALS